MSTITSTDALSTHVRGYAQAVRLHLVDLGPDVVDDLTDGLEADLTEAVLDQDSAHADAVGTHAFDLAERFGPTDRYADELRNAAGLPSAPARRAGRGPGGAISDAWTVISDRWRAAWRPMTSTPGWAATMDLVRSLAPAWWILRGWVGAQVILVALRASDVVLWPETTPARLVVVAAVLVSVQWGRGRWVPRWAWFPCALAVASVAAGLLAIPMVADVEADTQVVTGGSGYDTGWNDGYGSAQVSGTSTGGGPGQDGVWVDGVQVSNLFAYDAEGDPIRDVQLYDDRGRPVRTIGADATWDTWSVPDVPGSWSFQPAVASDGRTRWNVFPLSAVPAEQVGLGADGDGYLDMEGQEHPLPPTGVQPEAMPWPFLKAPTVIEDDAAAGSGSEKRDDPAEERRGESPTSDPASDPASDRDGETVRPGERPTSGSESREPTLEATQAD